MKPSEYTSVGSGVTILAQVLMYLTHWPLVALSETQAMAFAGMLVILAGSLHGTIQAWLTMRANKPVVVPPPPPPVISGAPEP